MKYAMIATRDEKKARELIELMKEVQKWKEFKL